MKRFYIRERITFFTAHPDRIEIRIHHSLFWGLVSFTTSKGFNNKIA